MLLSSLLDAKFIKLGLAARSKAEVINLLLDEMFTHYRFQHSRDEVQQAINARETLKGTVFPTGLAVPHARIDLFNDILIAIATLKEPIEEDGIPIRMVVLILTSKTTSNLYLNCLAAFTKMSTDHTTFNQLIESANAEEIINHIQVMNVEVKPELTVEQIMVHQIVGIEPTASVRQVIDLLCEHNISYLPVIGSNGTFMGEITVLEVMRLGIPNYAQMIGNVNYLKAFEPMEELLAKEETILARDVMEPPTITFSRQTSVVEAVFTFTKSRKRHIPVVENHQVVGLVSYMDILTKVLRA